MWKHGSPSGVYIAAVIALSTLTWSEQLLAAAQTQAIAFDGTEALSGWAVTGDVIIDMTRCREGARGSLKIAPGGKALLRLRDTDESGKVEFWIYDDGTRPEDAKAHRVGPRWGLVQSDSRLLAVGTLYASYLGGAEGYTATVCDGRDWFDRLSWLGVDRSPAGWHKWTFDFDEADGLQVFHNDREITAIDPSKTGLKGFRSFAVWGDEQQGSAQTIWLTDLSITLGGPAETIPDPGEGNPYSEEAIRADPDIHRPVVIYTPDDAPSSPGLEELTLRNSISQYGITWTFRKPVRVGQFINGDWYVVGPVTVEAIDPKPLYGNEIPRRELDRMDRERKGEHRIRNGFMLNPPARMEVAYDSGVRNWFNPSLIQRLPVAMQPGDSLVSTISMPKNLVLHAQLRNKIERGVDDSSPIRTAAVLTCVSEPQPADAFRPGFCDRQQRIYLARNLKRDLLPVAAATKSIPRIERYVRFTQRPWVGTCFFGFEEPVENMPQYGLEYGRVVGISALLLCTDLEPKQKELLLVNLVQVGIDLGGMVRAGHPGWTAWGGHGSGRKLPIVFAGLLLGDEDLANVKRTFPKVSFGEDEQTSYDDCWTGAKVVFAGHSGIDTVTGAGRSRGKSWGPYEHILPSQWQEGQNTSEDYRRCCTSVGWVAQALAMRLMHLERAWNHDAFFDYVDRWMYEDDSAFVKVIRQATGRDHDKGWARQGQAWDTFVNDMWAKHRHTLQTPIDAWKQEHDATDSRMAATGRSTASLSPAIKPYGATLTPSMPVGAVVVPAAEGALAKAIRSHAAGTVFYLKSGVHSGNGEMRPKAGSVLVGEQGAILDGENATAKCFIHDTGVIPYSASASRYVVTLRNLVVRNYSPADQECALMAPDTGQGWARALSDPADRNGWLIEHCTFIANRAGGACLGSASSARHCLFADNGQIGVKACGRNVQLLHCRSTHNNVDRKFNYMWEAGGTKFWGVKDMLVEGGEYDHNGGFGLWFDYVWDGNVVRNVSFHDNLRPGISIEMAAGVEVTGCTFSNDDLDGLSGEIPAAFRPWDKSPESGPDLWSGEIMLFNGCAAGTYVDPDTKVAYRFSSKTWIHGNTILDGGGGILCQYQDRAAVNPRAQVQGNKNGPVAGLVGIVIEDNTISCSAGCAVIITTLPNRDYKDDSGSWGPIPAAQAEAQFRGPVFRRNRYSGSATFRVPKAAVIGGSDDIWQWNDRVDIDLATWRSLGKR